MLELDDFHLPNNCVFYHMWSVFPNSSIRLLTSDLTLAMIKQTMWSIWKVFSHYSEQVPRYNVVMAEYAVNVEFFSRLFTPSVSTFIVFRHPVQTFHCPCSFCIKFMVHFYHIVGASEWPSHFELWPQRFTFY